MKKLLARKVSNKKLVIIALIAIIAAVVFAMVFTSSANADEKAPIDEVEDTTTTEEVVEESKADASDSKKVTRNSNISVTTKNEGSIVSASATNEDEGVKIVLETSVKNPTVVGEAGINASIFGAYVLYEGENITSSCTINPELPTITGSGEYTVVLKADCGSYGKASRYANVNVYVPAEGEQPKASSNTDTSISTTTPKTEVVEDKNGNQTRDTRATVEMTKVIINYADGSQKTFVKNSVENIYANQTTRVLFESEVPANYQISGNTLTVNGKSFTQQ